MATKNRIAKFISRVYKDAKRMKREGGLWFKRDQGARLAHDARLLIHCGFSDLVHEIRKTSIVLIGFIPIVTGPSGIIRRIATEVRFPDTYPREEPRAYDIEQRFKAISERSLADRHIGDDGFCCLWLSSRSEWNACDPNALRHFLRQLTVFFERQLICDVIKRWPGPEFAHGDAGYAQDIRETLQDRLEIISLYESILRGIWKPRRREPCPCGSGIAFVACHKVVFDELGRRVPQRFLDKVRYGVLKLLTIRA